MPNFRYDCNRLRLYAPATPAVLRGLKHAFLAYALLVAWSVSQHTLWADEADVWVMARETNWHDGIRFFSYTGHPPLWFSYLFIFARPGLPIEAMQWANAALGLAAAWLVLLHSPFAPWLRVALVFTQGLSFQYPVICRGYMLMLLLLFLIAHLYPTRHQRPWRYGALLALAFCTEAFAMPAIGVLGLYFAWERWHSQPRRWLGPVVLAALGGLLALASLLPWDGLDDMQGYYKKPKFYSNAFLNNIAQGFFPWALWDKLVQAFPELKQKTWRYLFCLAPGVLALLLGLWSVTWRWRLVMLAWLVTFFGIFSFLYYGQTWHAQLFPFFLAWTLWLHHSGGEPTPAPPAQRALPWVWLPALAFSLASAVVTHYGNARTPYSGGKDMANFIRRQGYDKGMLTSLVCFQTGTLSGYLPGTKLWIVGEDREAPYIIWGRYQDECAGQYYNRVSLRFLERARQERLIVFTTQPVQFPPKLQPKQLRYSPGTHEQFFLYAVGPEE